MTGAFGISKTGSGTLVILGSHLYSGATGVRDGVFGGNGSLAGSLDLDAGTKLYFDPSYTLSVAGTATFAHPFFGIGDLDGLNSSAPEGTYNLITGTVVGTFDNVGMANAADIGGGNRAYFEFGSLKLVVVPEPSSLALAWLGIAGLLIFRRGMRH